MELGRLREAVARRDADEAAAVALAPATDTLLLDAEPEEAARERLLSEVLAAVELVLDADGAALWREEADHALVLTASRSIPARLLAALDGHVTSSLQAILERWPQSPLVAVPIDDAASPLSEEERTICAAENIAGLAGVPARIPGQTLGLLVIVHRQPHAWTVRDLRLATGFAAQLATALQNARLFTSVKALASRLAAIHELSTRLSQLRDADAIGAAIVAEVGRLVDCDTVRVYRLDRERGLFRPVAASGTFVGIDGPPLEALTLGGGETLPGWVAKRNEPLVIGDASVERRAIVRSTTGPESVLLVPMSYGDEVHGVLVVSKAGLNRYGPADEQALSIFARYASQAIVNADNFERLQRQQAVLEQQLAGERRLLEVNEQLVSTLEPRRVLDEIADTLGSVVRYDRLTIYRTDGGTGHVEAVLSRGPVGETDATAARPTPDEGLTSWVLGRGEPVCANDVEGGTLSLEAPPASGPAAVVPESGRAGGGEHDRAEGLQNIIVVPLRVHGEVVGTLNLTRFGGPTDHFNEHEFELSKLFAGQASIALQNAETHLTVATRADLDALTGLRNHGTFERDLGALAVEGGEQFGLLMMDLDSFKAFNDTFGHPAGDTLLRTVGRAIVGATRQNDRAYRYGGDEFAVLLLGADRVHAQEAAERIRETVRDFAAGPEGLDVGVCVGVAHWPEDGPAGADLVRAADAALYRAKGLRVQRRVHGNGRSGAAALGALLDAARELLAAATPVEVAAVAARHAAVVAGTPDAFVALSSAGGLQQAAGTGAFATQPVVLSALDPLWGRVWEAAGPIVEEDAALGSRVGLRLAVDSEPLGLLGLALRPGASLPSQRLESLARLAQLAAEAVRRSRGAQAWNAAKAPALTTNAR